MHRVIITVVEAASQTDAVDAANEVFSQYLRFDAPDRLDGARYDYCKPMESGHSVAGSDRWTDFYGEPVAVPLDDEQGAEWVREYLGYQRRHYAEALYGFLQSHMANLHDSVETAPDAIREIVDFVDETRDEYSWGEGGKKLLEEYPRTIYAMHGPSYPNHWATALYGDASEVHVFQFIDDGWSASVFSDIEVEHMEELIGDPPDDSWVVPLDVHS